MEENTSTPNCVLQMVHGAVNPFLYDGRSGQQLYWGKGIAEQFSDH
jgi:hypothetical protein